MTDIVSKLTDLRRPRLLLRAARLGQNSYQRDRDLLPLLGATISTTSRGVLAFLFDEERDMESKRKTGDASYSVTRHVSLLIALLAETHHVATNN